MWQEAKNVYHLFVAFGASFWYGFPARKLHVIGVTGTDGKTTTVSLIYHILKNSGLRASMISSVGAIIGDSKLDTGFHVTNPDPIPLQRFIKKAALVSDYLVLEVTSHGLDQNRVFGIPFVVGVLTNVTHEHFDYHKTYSNYLHTKLQLLMRSKIAVINRDDESYKTAVDNVSGTKIVSFGLQKNSDVNLYNFPFRTKLFGEFNAYNILAAVSVCKQLGVSDEKIRSAIASFVPPVGRQEIVYDKDFRVIIDFAHTPNAFEKILPEVRKLTKNRVIHVFGSAAKRDETKRPLMGEASAKYADIIILTAEDSRGESVEKISFDIQKGIQKVNNKHQVVSQSNLEKIKVNNTGKYQFIFPDRKKAIHFAMWIAQKGDTVLLTGKGHEKSMNLGNGEEPWNEHQVVKEALLAREKELSQ